MDKQEIIDYLKGQTEWSGNHHYILVNKSELISMIEDLDELEFKNYLRDIKSQIDYLRIQGPGKVKSLRMLENMVDNMLTGYWSSTSIRTEKVKVPACVGKDLDAFTKARLKEDLVKDICLAVYDYSQGAPFDTATVSWCRKGSNLRTMIEAIWNGYEVEEEQKWVVKVDDNAYFVDFFDSLTPHLVDGLGWEVMRLDDKSKADAVALIIGGKAEKA